MLNVSIREVAGVAVIDLDGKIIMGRGTETFRNVVDDLLIDGQRKFLFNFSGVQFIDSAGLGEIVASFRTVKGLKGDMKIFNVGQKVYSTFSISKLLPILEIFDNEAEALRSFGAAKKSRGKKGQGAKKNKQSFVKPRSSES
jgi:anti-sigma B factor antagonist